MDLEDGGGPSRRPTHRWMVTSFEGSPIFFSVLFLYMLSFSLLYFNNIQLIHQKNRFSPMAQQVKNLPAMQEIQEMQL